MILWVLLGVGYSFPEFYHSTDSINSILSQVPCVEKLGSSVDAFYWSSPETMRTFLLFGEHPRELISAEIGLAFLSQICNSALPSSILAVVNANPKGRQLVEAGDYCRRTNSAGVDINRNWDYHWKSQEVFSETYSGSFPFSETETLEIKQLLENYSPHLFISVHSGRVGLYTPYAFSKQEPLNKELLEVMQTINKKYCLCTVGPAAKKLHYESYGNCLDYAYDVAKVPFAFAWEVFEDSNLSFLQSSAQQCLGFFNPTEEQLYQETIDKWVLSIKETINIVRTKLNKS